MKRYMKYAFVLILLFVSIQACEKQEDDNKIPTCFIIGFDHVSVFAVGDTVDIELQAHDRDGLVKHSALYINEELMQEFTAEPYFYSWNTWEKPAGKYLIKARATDNRGVCFSDQ